MSCFSLNILVTAPRGVYAGECASKRTARRRRSEGGKEAFGEYAMDVDSGAQYYYEGDEGEES